MFGFTKNHLYTIHSESSSTSNTSPYVKKTDVILCPENLRHLMSRKPTSPYVQKTDVTLCPENLQICHLMSRKTYCVFRCFRNNVTSRNVGFVFILILIFRLKLGVSELMMKWWNYLTWKLRKTRGRLEIIPVVL